MRLIVRLIALAYPADLRAEMAEVFAHCLAVERARRGRAGRAVAGLYGVWDSVTFAVAQRRDRRRRRGWPAAPRPSSFGRFSMFGNEIRSALRASRKRPAFTLAIVLMLALGIGSTTAIFSVVQGVLLRPLAFPQADRLIQVWGSLPARNLAQMSLTEADFWDLHDMNHSFEAFGAWHGASFSLTGFDTPERVTGARVSVGFLRALGVTPIAGRIFTTGEDDAGAPADRVVLIEGFFQRRFGGDRSLVGRAITLDGKPYTVLGVVPRATPWLDTADVLVPFLRDPKADRLSWEWASVGRLRAGVTPDAALQDVNGIFRSLEARYPGNKGLSGAIQLSSTWFASNDLRRMLWVLLGACGLLLAIACINVTNLLLARASSRVRENAVRTALGARRGDLIREQLTESLLLSAAGAGLGWLVADGLLRILQAVDPGGIPRLADVSLNLWVAAFAVGVAMLVGLVTGLVPALHAPLDNIVSALRQGQRGQAGDRRQHRLRGIFVAAEVALSLMLLVGAGLLVRSLEKVLTVDRGFQSDHRLLVTVTIPGIGPRVQQTMNEVIARVGALPEVQSVAAVSGQPLSNGSTGLGIVAADAVNAGSEVPWATWRIITTGYFPTIGLPLLKGRAFTDADEIGKPWRVVISKRLADSLWPGQDPIGRTAILWKGQGDNRAEVIGVVGDMRERGLEADPTLAVYFPSKGWGARSVQLVIHTRSAPGGLVASVRAAVAAVDQSLPVSNARTLEDIVSASVATRRFTMLLLAAFAGLALVLALAGVYGVLAYSVARRTSEIGVRLALGARRGSVVTLMLAQGFKPVLAGLLVGLAGAISLSRFMTTLLFGVTAGDVPTYIAVVAALTAVAALASYLPARRALGVDPAIALRND